MEGNDKKIAIYTIGLMLRDAKGLQKEAKQRMLSLHNRKAQPLWDGTDPEADAELVQHDQAYQEAQVIIRFLTHWYESCGGTQEIELNMDARLHSGDGPVTGD